jgi:HlyD family secretion protein
MNPRLRLGLIAAVVALAIVGLVTRGLGLFAPGDGKGLALSGNVDIRQVDLGFRVGGRIAAIPIEEGARVAAGALLASLDPQPIKDQLAVDTAQVALATAQLDRQRNGNRTQDIAQAEDRLVELRAQLLKAREDLDRRTPLAAKGPSARPSSMPRARST